MRGILAAHEGRLGMLKAIFGGGKEGGEAPESRGRSRPATAQNVLAVFRAMKGG